MNDNLTRQLYAALPKLLNIPAAQLSLEKTADGLSHHSFRCDAGSSKYFVKVYPSDPRSVQEVLQINEITKLMCRKGIPASQLAAYSTAYANVVVHSYVDAEKIGWDPALLAPLAKVYSNICLIGLLEKKVIPNRTFLDALKPIEVAILEQISNNIGISPRLNQQALEISMRVSEYLTRHLPDKPLLVTKHHDDFTERNILADQSGIRLVCDWDSWRHVVFYAHLACSAARFCTEAPMYGKLDKQRLEMFLGALSPKIILPAAEDAHFAQLFPYLALIKHIASYTFRNVKVAQGRPELEKSLLADPLEHCQWMMENRAMVAEWVGSILEDISQGRKPHSA